MTLDTKTRLNLRKGLKDNRIYKIYGSPNLPIATYYITSSEIDDPI